MSALDEIYVYRIIVTGKDLQSPLVYTNLDKAYLVRWSEDWRSGGYSAAIETSAPVAWPTAEATV